MPRPRFVSRSQSGTSTISRVSWAVSISLIFSLSGMFGRTIPLQTIHDFGGKPDGLSPTSGLVMGKSGAIYGSTSGSSICGGTMYELKPPVEADGVWQENVIHCFRGGASDGAFPSGTPAMGPSGALYGTTGSGGPGNFGTVFELKPPVGNAGLWTETLLHVFTGQPDGIEPLSGVVIGKEGALYGTTYVGGNYGGIIFELKPPQPGSEEWREKVLYTFSDESTGENPGGGLTFGPDGCLYGTTLFGGIHNSGVVFRLSPPEGQSSEWIYSVLYEFQSEADGSTPQGSLAIGPMGELYGVTSVGFETYGTVFELQPGVGPNAPWVKTTLHQFGLIDGDGFNPISGVTINSEGELFGTTPSTTPADDSSTGTLYEMVTPTLTGGGWTERVLHRFFEIGNGGYLPSGPPLVGPEGAIYGVTESGGSYDHGTVFELRPVK